MESLLAGIALVRRRYTGETEQFVRCGDGVVRVDLTEDRPVRELLADLSGLPDAAVDPEFPDELAKPMSADLTTVLAAITADPDQSTVDILAVSAYERRRPVWPDRPRPRLGATIPEAFAAVVARHPDRAAVLADDLCLTYRELGSAVAATAAALGPGGPAAVLCEHGASTVIGLLGALTAGRAYVPLDPSFPERRLAEVLADSGADVLITDASQRDLAGKLAGREHRIVHRGHSGAEEDVLAGLVSPARPDDPAYLLYTSGSTGEPKGVVQSHRNVLFGIGNHVRNFAITPGDRTSVLTSFGFDMAVTDLFGALLSGAAAVPVDIRTHGLGQLAERLASRGVTIYHSTPTVYRYLLASLGEGGRLPAIRAVLLGGEDVTRHDMWQARRHFAADAVFVNGYGTTEISFATQYHLSPDVTIDQAVVPIGYPLDGIEVLLVDRDGRPTCLTGEIMVRCPHVALGYWRRPELTRARFVEHRGIRSYLTGDLARRLPDGRLVFLGRADRMVKIRGHRVELGEVEARLAALPRVAHAAVVARDNAQGDKEIIGYVVPSGDTDPAELRGALAAELPDFMVPRAIVRLDALPLGVTGKLDVDALPAPPEPSTVDNELDAVQSVIAAAWRDVLGVAGIDPQASYVELGGHSLQLALIQGRLETELGVRLPLAKLVEFPTVAGLAAHLRAGADVAEDPAVTRATERMRRRREARR